MATLRMSVMVPNLGPLQPFGLDAWEKDYVVHIALPAVTVQLCDCAQATEELRHLGKNLIRIAETLERAVVENRQEEEAKYERIKERWQQKNR